MIVTSFFSISVYQRQSAANENLLFETVSGMGKEVGSGRGRQQSYEIKVHDRNLIILYQRLMKNLLFEAVSGVGRQKFRRKALALHEVELRPVTANAVGRRWLCL